MVNTKSCTKCKLTKPATEFYRANRGRYGVAATCKPCRLKLDQAYNHKRDYTALTRKSRAKFPEKSKARQQVQYAVTTGRLIKKACEVCGDARVHAHHTDYSKPLEVKWLCQTHHAEVHAHI